MLYNLFNSFSFFYTGSYLCLLRYSLKLSLILITSGNLERMQPEKLDVSIIYKFLRNTCDLEDPAEGWGNPPKPGNIELSDDIERIRQYRNFITHKSSSDRKMTRDEYNLRFLELQQVRLVVFFRLLDLLFVLVSNFDKNFNFFAHKNEFLNDKM